MLTPFQLANIPDPLVALFEDLEGFIISDISRRIAKTGIITDTAAYQAMRAQELGIGLDTIKEEVAKTLTASKEAITSIIEDSTITALSYDDEVYKKAGLSPTPLRQSPYVMNTIKAVIRQTNNEINNITRSIGFKTPAGFKPIAKYYQHACDLAHLKIVNGFADYKTAVRQAVKECADSGIQFVDYESGHVNRMDVAVRRAVMSGVRKTTGELAIMRADEFGVTTMELTAHQGARPSHAEWQGQIVDRSGQNHRYLTLDDIGYGTGDGFQGWNCRHDWAPFFPGISERSWTAEQLKNIDPPPFEYDGKTYTHYEATQRQRRMETAMRRTKRELIGYDASGDKDYFTASSIKLRRQKDEYAAFSKAAGLRTQNDRAGVLGYGHSISQKAVWAEKKSAQTTIPSSNKLFTSIENRGIIYKSRYEADKVFRPLTEQLWPRLNQPQKDAAYKYTVGSGPFNRPLRGYDRSWSSYIGPGKVSLNNESAEQYIQDLTTAINKSQGLPQDTWLFRGSDRQSLAGLLQIDCASVAPSKAGALNKQFSGKLVADEAFFSTGVAPDAGFSNSILYRIFAPKGTKGIYAEPFSYFGKTNSYGTWNGMQVGTTVGPEAEMILQRGSHFKIVRITNNKGKLEVVLEVK